MAGVPVTDGHVPARRVPRVLMLVPAPDYSRASPQIVPMTRRPAARAGLRRRDRLLEPPLGRTKPCSRRSSVVRPTCGASTLAWSAAASTSCSSPPRTPGAGRTRDIPLVLVTKRLCSHRVIQFHGSNSDRLSAPGHTLLKLASRVLVGACDATLVLSRAREGRVVRVLPVQGALSWSANPFTPEPVSAASAPALSGDVRKAGRLYAPRAIAAVPRRRRSSDGSFRSKGILDLVRAVARVNCDHAVPASRRRRRAERTLAWFRWPTSSGYAGNVWRLRGSTFRGAGPRALLSRQAEAFVLPHVLGRGFPDCPARSHERRAAGRPHYRVERHGRIGLKEGVNCALRCSHGRPDLLAEALIRILARRPSSRLPWRPITWSKVEEFAPEFLRAAVPRDHRERDGRTRGAPFIRAHRDRTLTRGIASNQSGSRRGVV